MTNAIKITRLTGQQVAALTNAIDNYTFPDRTSSVSMGKTTATFNMTADEAIRLIEFRQSVLALQFGRRGGDYQALHAVIRKLRDSA